MPEIPTELRAIYERAGDSKSFRTVNSSSLTRKLIERIADLEAKKAQLKSDYQILLDDAVEMRKKFESMRDINDANLECYNNCALENRALRAQVERQDAALRQAAEGLDMAMNRFRKMGIMEEAERYFPYIHAVDAACAAEPEEQA